MSQICLSRRSDRENCFQGEEKLNHTLESLFNLLPAYVSRGSLPPEIDPKFYRMMYADLATFSDEDLMGHFERHGRGEGRMASPAAHRAGFIATIPDLKSLEIGPFTKPILRGINVKYLDVLDKNGLIERAQRVNYRDGRPVEIDFVSPTGDLEVIGNERFDLVLSSHNLEHQPDLIRHLNQVENALNDGGWFFLIIPDRRYCFDHFLPASDIEEVKRAFAEKRRVHTVKSIYESYALTTHNNPERHWMGDHADPNEHKRAERAADAVRAYHDSRGGYVDVHAWQFEPLAFRALMKQLKAEGLIGLSIERVYDTVWGQFEFMAVLRK